MTDVLIGLKKLKQGDFNEMSQERQPDGSVLITLTSTSYPEIYRFQVKNLYQEDEEVWDDDKGDFVPTRNL